jgi:hypothetical protein
MRNTSNCTLRITKSTPKKPCCSSEKTDKEAALQTLRQRFPCVRPMPRRGGINARLAYDFFRFLKRPHHAHLMMTTRRLDREGFTEKTRELDDMKKRGPEEILAIRELWEHEQNLALQRAEHIERVTRLSNKAQGIEREPEPKLGEAATALMRQGKPSRRGDLVQQVRQRNSMRYNMARQRSGALGKQKEDAIARALQAAAAQGFNAAAGPKGAPAQAVAFALQKAKEQTNPPPPPARLRRRGSGPEFDR